MKKKLIIFMPSIEDGGVEKNLFTVANYLNKKIKNIKIITCNNDFKKRFSKKIKFIGTKSKFWNNCNKKIKYIVCLSILLKIFFSKKIKSCICVSSKYLYNFNIKDI